MSYIPSPLISKKTSLAQNLADIPRLVIQKIMAYLRACASFYYKGSRNSSAAGQRGCFMFTLGKMFRNTKSIIICITIIVSLKSIPIYKNLKIYPRSLLPDPD